MPKTTNNNRGGGNNNTLQLQDQLVLASWFARRAGFGDPADMLKAAKECSDTPDHEQSAIVHLIRSRQNLCAPPLLAALDEMDDAIRGDLAKINRRRSPPVRLKYFQYLAALSAEWYLRRRADSIDELAIDINDFVGDYNIGRQSARFPPCDSSHLAKLAFWMATGSGKTLLMHLNYWQCRRHLPFAPNNILLITPNEDMTKQHIAELQDSSIPCYRHGEGGGGVLSSRADAVCVLDIHKLQDNPGKQSGTVKPEFFEGPNLVFVDEGHKGGGNTDDAGYYDKRDRLAKDGFAMEYSATFGQAFVNLQAGIKKERMEEYGRAIAFDYSYRYFFDDGYGKDFFVLNTDGDADYHEDIMLLGNLLAFCQQRIAFDAQPQTMAEYQIAPPLLLMLGAKVTANNKGAQTDIVRIVDFLRRAAADDNWLRQKTEAIINGEAGMLKDGKDMFGDKFELLRRHYGGDIDSLCAALREKIFHAKAPGALRLSLLAKTGKKDKDKCEIALRIADNKPFALVYVGEARKLREITERDAPDVQTGDDMLQESLFDSINAEASPVNILIGAKKFMEGWSSWRVCGIGLLNVGTTEGPLIIQLFGRGVRLRGLGFSLKRSAADDRPRDDKAAQCLRLLETLNIFAVRASFMKNFRDYLHREGVVCETIEVPVEQTPGLPTNLPVPQMPPTGEYDEWQMLGGDKVKVEMDLSSAITIGQGGNAPQETMTAQLSSAFNDEVCRRIDFGALHTRLLAEQNNGGIGNIIIASAGQLPKVLEKCTVITDKNDPLKNFQHHRLQQTAFAALRQAAKKQHARNLRQWQKEGTKGGILDKRHGNVITKYKLRLRGDKAELIKKIRDIVAKGEQKQPYNSGGRLPRLYYERHWYNPLLAESGEYSALSPPGLNKGERDFIDALREYAGANPPDAELCLLRNLPKADDGIGFVLDDGKMFYPDFILWLTQDNETRVVFVEPHGMHHANTYDHDGKAQLWKYLQTLKLPFELDSFIISTTPHKDMRGKNPGKWTRDDFAKRHILFMDDLQDEERRGAAFAGLLKPPAQ